MIDYMIKSLTKMHEVIDAQDLTDGERAAVRGGNARRLLGLG